MKPQYFISIIILILLGYFAILLLNNSHSHSNVSSLQNGSTLGKRTKTVNCKAQIGLPDRSCTPGAVFAGVTKNDVCRLGYSRSVRNVPLKEKQKVYAEYGIQHHAQGEYEVDHLISLELGGSNSIANLWPESADPRPGFHEKDQVENYLHQQVCSGDISLQQAQQEIATNWLQVYDRIK